MCLLILDVDETLLHAADTALDRAEDLRLGDDYWVYYRPGLQDFLQRIGQHYRLALWTASTQPYLEALLQDVLGQFSYEFTWSRRRCTLSMNHDIGWYEYTKNLKKVFKKGYARSRTLIVDDSPWKVRRQYGNYVRVPEFVGDAEDTVLGHLFDYLIDLQRHEDVTRIEKRGWLQAYDGSAGADWL